MLLQLLVTIPVLLVSLGSNRAAGESLQEIGVPLDSHEYATVAAFEQSVQDYVALHRRLAWNTPPLQVTADPRQLRTAVDSLGHAIRVARSDAERGDVFTDSVARLLRRRIACALGSLDPEALMHEMKEDDEDAGAPRLVVNGPFPWNSGNAMWPSILAALPQLPEELEYRLMGADLVLVDIRANVVVDVLADALLSDQ
jgi:hypothetical protein